MAFMNADSARELGARCGFSLELSDGLVEIGGAAHVFRHDASGARLLLLENDDPNKSFSISFKTPATDDTGVFHILEHSVLCGSDRFPVKEPFVTLLKSSMQTFLNAMTFPDKTVYPVASTNEQDLMNLMDVYMDAVLSPNIYSNERIFEQEGWHLEVAVAGCEVAAGEVVEVGADGAASEAGADGASAGAPAVAGAAAVGNGFGELAYNGVVYNEMKGALSDPDQVLYDALCAAMFPDTTYRFESGGTPEAIPTLTYEQFLETHRRHYRLDNSYIVLYGDLDAERFMRHLDAEFLSPVAVKRAGEQATLPQIGLQAPVRNEGVKCEMATTPDNSCTAFGYVAGTSADRERVAAVAVLLDAIMGSNEAPLKRALLDADIADDCDGYLSDSLLQPFAMISARGLHDGAVERMGEVIERTVARLAGADGQAPELDEELIEASLSHSEFAMREYDFGYPDGVALSISAMCGWLYDDSPEAALSYIRYEDLFASLRTKLGCGYYAKLLGEVFLENEHVAQVEVVPVERDGADASAAGLAEMRASMSEDELAAVAERARLLREAQMAPDAPEDAVKLPGLTRADIGEAPLEPAVACGQMQGHRILRHEVPTHGIAYFTQFFDLLPLRFDELPYVSVLALLLGKLDTANHSAAQIDTLVQSKLGSLRLACEVFQADDEAGANGVCDGEGDGEGAPAAADALTPAAAGAPTPAAAGALTPAAGDGLMPKLTVTASCLESRTSEAVALVSEILTTTDFSDTKRVLDVLVQRKVLMEQRFGTSGNSVAVSRAASYIDRASVLRELMGGIDFYVFLKGLIAKMESGDIDVASKLADLCNRVFGQFGVVVSFGGTDDAYAAFAAGMRLPNADLAPERALIVPEPVDKHEAFAVPTDVTYSALVADRGQVCGAGSAFSGEWLVLSRILSYDYLWNEVRVVGGAYGVSFNMGRLGLASFSSYRDPHVSQTMQRFKGSSEWMADFNPCEAEFEGYVVSTAAAFDRPVKPRSLIRRQATMALTGYARERYLEYRQQVLSASLEGVKQLSAALDSLCQGGHACVVGNRELLAELDGDAVVVDLLELGCADDVCGKQV